MVFHIIMVLSMDILFTHLLHVCNDVSHLQTELVILLLLIVKQNHCFCKGVCVCVWVGVLGERG